MDQISKTSPYYPSQGGPIDRGQQASPVLAQKPTTPVDQAIHRLEVEIDNLAMDLNQLYDRLQGYVADSLPSSNTQPTLAPIPGNSHIVQKLVGFSTRIAIMDQELQSIKARLEA